MAESDGRIVFMTTNYAERLDPALIRPGRVDFKHYIGHASEYQMFNMFLKFYPEASVATAQGFAAKLAKLEMKVSSAQIQGYFMEYKNEPVLAYENVDKFAVKESFDWETIDEYDIQLIIFILLIYQIN